MFIEDYLILLFRLSIAQPKVALATYDVSFVSSVVDQIFNGMALTEKQLALSKLLLNKYARQLRKFNVRVDKKSLEPRLGIRPPVQVARTVGVEENKIVMLFPYDPALITKVRAFANVSKGAVKWAKPAKVWEIALTEPNVVWVLQFAIENSFTVTGEFDELLSRIQQITNTASDYALTLVQVNGEYRVTNAPSSLQEAFSKFSTLDEMVDNSPVLGYTVSEELTNQVISTHGANIANLMLNREVDGVGYESYVFDYIKQTDRFPAFFYGSVFTKAALEAKFTECIVDECGRRVRCVYKNMHDIKPMSDVKPRVVVSDTTMLYSLTWQRLIQDSEKVILTCKRLT